MFSIQLEQSWTLGPVSDLFLIRFFPFKVVPRSKLSKNVKVETESWNLKFHRTLTTCWMIFYKVRSSFIILICMFSHLTNSDVDLHLPKLWTCHGNHSPLLYPFPRPVQQQVTMNWYSSIRRRRWYSWSWSTYFHFRVNSVSGRKELLVLMIISIAGISLGLTTMDQVRTTTWKMCRAFRILSSLIILATKTCPKYLEE